MGEWLGTLGLAWPRLLLYPGGLSALGLAWVLDCLLVYSADRSVSAPTRTSPVDGARGWLEAAASPVDGAAREGPGRILDLSTVVAPLLIISLLPLPQSGYFAYTPDLLVALVLLEWPWLCWYGRRCMPVLSGSAMAGAVSSVSSPWTGGQGMLEGQRQRYEAYGLLVLSLLAVAQTQGSLRLEALTVSSAPATLAYQALRWLGMAGWNVALLALLLREADLDKTMTSSLRWGLRLRTGGHVLLAWLPWFPLLQPRSWLVLLPLLLLVSALTLVTWRPGALLRQPWPIVWRSLMLGIGLAFSRATYELLVARLH